MGKTKILHANEEQDSREINLQELDSFDSKNLDESINSGTVSPVKRKSTKSSKTISSSKALVRIVACFTCLIKNPGLRVLHSHQERTDRIHNNFSCTSI